MEIMKLIIKEDSHSGTHLSFFVFYNKITLFEKKYDTKLITLISMHHLKPLVSLSRFIKNQNVDAQIALHYTCLSILLATFNYRVRGTAVPTRAFHARLAR